MKLEFLPAWELGNLVNSRQISAVESINYFINYIEKHNPEINAFTYTKFEDALEEAQKIDDRLDKAQFVGPFAGVPVGLKDFLPSKIGWTNSHGGVPSLVRIDDADSEFYKAARKLGAIAIGKTNAPAFGFSGACQNKMYGQTKNPFCLDRTSGGSSGGSAAAVASGMLGLSEGGDAGGSIRIPSGWCNLFGFKSSLGTVPSLCRPDAWTATHPYCFNGALTRTVRDSAIIMSTMAHYDPRDPISLPINHHRDFVYDIQRPLSSFKGKKIAYTDDFDLIPEVDHEVKQVVQKAVKALEDAGAEVQYVHFNWRHSYEEIVYCWAWAISVDTALDLEYWKDEGLDLVKDHRDEIPEEFIYFNEVASMVNIHDFRKFNEIRTDILDRFEDVFTMGYDYIISPTAICKPLPLKDNGRCISVNGVPVNPEINFIAFAETPMANFVGYPAASIPAGFTEDGCPIGYQVIGKQYRDGDVFHLASVSERVNPWNHRYFL